MINLNDDNLRLIFAEQEKQHIEDQIIFYKKCQKLCQFGIMPFIIMICIMAIQGISIPDEMNLSFAFITLIGGMGVSGLCAVFPVWLKQRYWEKALLEHNTFLKKYNR